MSGEANDRTVDLPASFGNYRLVEKLAVGGMAEIFKAKTTGIEGFEKVLVVKRLHERLSRDDDFIEMIIDEAKIAVRLNHPNIGRVFDLGRVGSQYFIAMEYIEGPDLGRMIEYGGSEDQTLSVAAVLHVGAEVCAGLHYAHTRTDEQGRPLNIVHRDISPPNVMLSVEGEVKIVDFGIAKARERVQDTQRGRIKGKFHYMAPEQARAGRVDARTDVFATGMVLYELLTGVNPYEGVDENEILEIVRTADVPPLEYYWPSVDPELDHLIGRALATDPSERFQNARALEQALVDYRQRKLESFGRRRLARLVRNVWNDLQSEGHEASPEEETGRMTPHEYEANESSLIFDAGDEVGGQFGEDPPTEPTDAPDENPFGDDEPTQVWRGPDGDRREGPEPRSPGSEGGNQGKGGAPEGRQTIDGVGRAASQNRRASTGGGQPSDEPSMDRELPPPPSDDDHFAPGDEEAEDDDSGEQETSDERPRAARQPAPTSPSKKRRRPPAQGIETQVRRLVTRLEDAGLDRRVQRMLLAAFGVTGVIAGIVALFAALSAPEEKSISSADRVESQESASGERRLASNPSGAKVRLDGETVGETPVTLESLEVGETHRVTLDKAGFEKEERVFVAKRDADPLVVELDERRGRLRVTTEPEGAEVMVDGEKLGEAPVEVDDLGMENSHEVEVVLDDRSQSREVTWDEHEPQSKHLAISLPEASDDEEVASSDESARPARSDPEPAAREAPSRGAAGAPSGGRRQEENEPSTEPSAASAGTTSEEEQAQAEQEQGSETTNLDLWGDDQEEGGEKEKEAGYVSIQVEDGWGKVYVDGELVASETPVLRHELAPGTHEVRVYYPVLERSSKDRTVQIEPGEHTKEIFSP